MRLCPGIAGRPHVEMQGDLARALGRRPAAASCPASLGCGHAGALRIIGDPINPMTTPAHGLPASLLSELTTIRILPPRSSTSRLLLSSGGPLDALKAFFTELVPGSLHRQESVRDLSGGGRVWTVSPNLEGERTFEERFRFFRTRLP